LWRYIASPQTCYKLWHFCSAVLLWPAATHWRALPLHAAVALQRHGAQRHSDIAPQRYSSAALAALFVALQCGATPICCATATWSGSAHMRHATCSSSARQVLQRYCHRSSTHSEPMANAMPCPHRQHHYANLNTLAVDRSPHSKREHSHTHTQQTLCPRPQRSPSGYPPAHTKHDAEWAPMPVDRQPHPTAPTQQTVATPGIDPVSEVPPSQKPSMPSSVHPAYARLATINPAIYTPAPRHPAPPPLAIRNDASHAPIISARGSTPQHHEQFSRLRQLEGDCLTHHNHSSQFEALISQIGRAHV
jgi:hypothetical protein